MAHVDDGQLNAFLDGELSQDEARSVEAHLASCAECRARFDEARAFLKESGELLDLLLPRASASSLPAGAADAAASRPSRVSTTAKERAVEIDGATQQSPAVRPIFAREGVSPAPATAGKAPDQRRRLITWTRLAWAASVALALGVGYRTGNRRSAAGPLSDVAMAPSLDTAAPHATRQAQAAPAAPAAQSPRETRQLAPASSASTRSRRAAPVLVKPPGARGAPKTAPEQVLANLPPSAQRANETAKTGAPVPAVAGVTADQRRDADVAARTAAAAPTDRAAPAAAQAPDRLNRVAAPPSPAAGAVAGGRLEEAAVQTGEPRRAAFQRVSMEEAVRRLSGSMRLIDGMEPARVEVGPGRLVSGAAPERDVVRVVYADATGRPLLLDQQPGEGAGMSVNGLMPGDTLVTPASGGASQLRWVDRKGFWLSLTGTAPLDTLRAVVGRIR